MSKVSTSVLGEPLQCEFYLDDYLLQELAVMNKLTEMNWDTIGFLVGYEGDGKTTFAMTLCYYLDKNFTIDNVVFTPFEFELAVDTLPHGSTILWDEADDTTGNAMSSLMMSIKKKFKRIRSRNMKIFLCTPTFHDINKYFAITRTRFLIHVYADGLERGHFRFFGRENKKKLYINGKKYMDMGANIPDFYGKFTKLPKDFPVDIEEYEDKKQRAVDNLISEKNPKDIRMDIYNNLNIYFADRGMPVHKDDLVKILGVSQRMLYWYDQELKLKSIKS